MNGDHERMTVEALVSVGLLLACTCGLLLTRNVAAIRTWTVDQSGPADYREIQQAVDSAGDGDTILVHSGIYYESLVVNKRLTIVGQDVVSTVIDGNGSAEVVTLSADGITLTGFTIRGGDEGLTVLSNMSNLLGNALMGNKVGLVLGSGCEGNTISDNEIVLSDTYGIYGDRCGKNVIVGNNISSNSWDGIFLYASEPCVLDSNRIFSNVMDGARIRYSSNNTIKGNLFSANDNGLVIYSDDDPIRKKGVSKYNTAENNTFVNNSCGIKIVHAAASTEMAGNVIWENLIGYNGIGLNVSGSNGNLIFNNDFVNNSKQASVNRSINNSWDGGYYVGGNYWSDYNSTDSHWGVYQNETGSDRVVDSAYLVSANPAEEDNYPFADADAWLEIPEISIISPINGTYRQNLAQEVPLALRMNKPVWMSFSLDGGSNVTTIESLNDLPVGTHRIMLFANDTYGNEVSTEVRFTITFAADLTLDGTVNILDISIVAYSYGESVGSQRWNPDADFNDDGVINIVDVAMVAKEFQKTV